MDNYSKKEETRLAQEGGLGGESGWYEEGLGEEETGLRLCHGRGVAALSLRRGGGGFFD